MTRRLLLLVAVVCAAGPLLAADFTPKIGGKKPANAEMITLRATLSPADPFSDANEPGRTLSEVRPGDKITLTITANPKSGWHTFPVTKKAPKQQKEQLTQIVHEQSQVFFPASKVLEAPEPHLVNEGPEVGELYEHPGPVYWTQDISVSPLAPAGTAMLKFKVFNQVCEKNCVQGWHEFEIPLTVKGSLLPEGAALGPTAYLATDSGPEVLLAKPPTPTSGRDGGGGEKPPGFLESLGFLGFLIESALWGLGTLLTPCVFPMIPITVSFFLKQSEQRRHPPLLMALIYSGTIVLVLTASGMVLGTVLNKVAQHWGTSLFLSVLFTAFALSLLGMYELTLPNSLSNFTFTQQGRGGLLGTVFMALTFSIISFACVGPIYGLYIVRASTTNEVGAYLKLLAGVLTFSAAFASPFFVLAMFPGLLKALPRSGSWMNTFKVVMGFIEVAAALKFLRQAELYYFAGSSVFTYELVMGAYVALCLLCAAYLLGLYRLPHDHDVPHTLGVPRALFALVFLALGAYLAPGLIDHAAAKVRQRGEVYALIDSFLLQDPEKHWSGDLKAGLAKAREEKKRVFIDFTGFT